jgi:hypothetical protein
MNVCHCEFSESLFRLSEKNHFSRKKRRLIQLKGQVLVIPWRIEEDRESNQQVVIVAKDVATINTKPNKSMLKKDLPIRNHNIPCHWLVFPEKRKYQLQRKPTNHYVIHSYY